MAINNLDTKYIKVFKLLDVVVDNLPEDKWNVPDKLASSIYNVLIEHKLNGGNFEDRIEGGISSFLKM
jgi:hypothetical protein